MSTILDALKKSEQERKRNDIPTLSDMPAPQERARPWPWVVVLLILILVAVLAIFLMRGSNFSNTSHIKPKEIIVSNETIASEQAENNLRVNVVSWSDSPAQRFVIVDGKLARENEFIRPGLKVEEIKKDSVILIERGTRLEVSP